MSLGDLNAVIQDAEAPVDPVSQRAGPERVLRALIAVSMFAMMLTTTADVALRYLISSPLAGSYEIVQMMLGVVVFAALPLATRSNAHINIGLLDGLFRGAAAKLKSILVTAVSAVVVAAIAYTLWELGDRLLANNRTIGALELPIGVFAKVFAGFTVLTAVVHLVMLVEDLRGWRRKGAAR